MKVKILSWNVRGVNDPDKRKVIKNFIRTQRVDLVCLQETKVQEINKVLAYSLGVGCFSKLESLECRGDHRGVFICFGIKEELVWWT